MRRATLRLCVLLFAFSAGCYRAHERAVDAAVDARVPSTPLVWVLVHPSDAPLGPGLFLFDEVAQTIVRRLPLPDGVTSPHALAWDGRSLWLGGYDDDSAIREIDPESGRELSRFPSVLTEGIAVDGETFWWAGTVDALTPLLHVAHDGARISTTTLHELAVQDLVRANDALYYLVNDDLDRIMRFDPVTSAVTELARNVDEAPYSLGFDGTHLAVAVDGRIRRYDPTTGALVRESALAVPGWITAIAFVR